LNAWSKGGSQVVRRGIVTDPPTFHIQAEKGLNSFGRIGCKGEGQVVHGGILMNLPIFLTNLIFAIFSELAIKSFKSEISS